MTAKLKIIVRAVKIRLANGEDIDDILYSYPALTDAEKQEVKNAIENED